MLQSWDNFMSPSGGSMENDMEFGLSSLAIDFGSSLVNKHIFEPMRKQEVSRLTARGIKATAAYSNVSLKQQSPRFSPSHRIASERQAYYSKERTLSGIRQQIAGTNLRYSGLKAGAKAIGWGYLALASASIMEGLVTPGLSASGTASNEQMMSGGPLDSSQAYTQRQRALMAIHDSQSGARNVFGSEAALLHR